MSADDRRKDARWALIFVLIVVAVMAAAIWHHETGVAAPQKCNQTIVQHIAER